MKYRHEQKYLINYHEYTLIKMRLGQLLAVDSNAGPEGSYTVRSLYFDDYYNSAYNEKYAGILNRSKYRIRLYNMSAQRINLERKIKTGAYNHKQSTAMTMEEVNCVLQGDYGFMLRSPSDLLKVFYYECVANIMRPRVIVEFEREPYLMEAGDVRITFDRNIRAGMEGFDLFAPFMSMIEALPPDLLIMEVKFTDFLPSMVRHILPREATEYVAVSKYILACDKTMHKRFSYA